MPAAKLIRDARTARGLTQTELARRSGTSQATLSAYENGARVPSTATLQRILAAAGQRLTSARATQAVVSPGRAELAERGRILRQVLDLADALPHRRRGALRYPPLKDVVRKTP